MEPANDSTGCPVGSASGRKGPFRGFGDPDGYLWDHGGYDVESPEAVAQRELRNERHAVTDAATSSATLAALDGTGPWPTRSTTRTGPVTVVDVDSFGDFAVVLAATDGEHWRRVGPMLGNWVFHRDAGGWTRLGGGGGGSGTDPLLERHSPHPANRPLQLSGSGGVNVEPEKRRGAWVRHAEILCAPNVARVEIDRSNQRRLADTSSGPGWIVALWLKGAEPTLTAYDAQGRQLDVLRPDVFERELASRGGSGRPWRLAR